MSEDARLELPQLAREPTGTPTVVEGRVDFGPVARGSKQQHVGPVILTQSGEAVRFFIGGDNPFSNDLARRWEGQRISVPGTWRNGVVEVEEHDIAALDAPKSGTILEE